MYQSTAYKSTIPKSPTRSKYGQSSNSHYYPINTVSNNYDDYNFEEKRNYTSNNRTFSREYVNELKGIYEKEKEEMQYKNHALQTNLDRLKSTLTDQVLNKYLRKDLHSAKTTRRSQVQVKLNVAEARGRLFLQIKQANYREK